MLEFQLKFHWNLFLRVRLTISQHWFRYGLAPNRRQTITWINADPVHWRIYAALGGDELNHRLHCSNQTRNHSFVVLPSDIFTCMYTSMYKYVRTYATYLCIKWYRITFHIYFIYLISLVMIERIYTLSYYHHQIGSMNYHPLFRVRSSNNGMGCMSLYILKDGDLTKNCGTSRVVSYFYLAIDVMFLWSWTPRSARPLPCHFIRTHWTHNIWSLCSRLTKMSCFL